MNSSEFCSPFQFPRLPMSGILPAQSGIPHFNKEALAQSLKDNGIGYIHLQALGGRRKPVKDSTNTRWRNSAFRGYADHMQTSVFEDSIAALQQIALKETVAYMCAEAVWWSCHRSLISDYLKIREWKVMNIMSGGKAQEHPFTSAARIVNGELRYDEAGLF